VDPEPAEARIASGYDGRSSAIAYGSQQALQTLGLWWGMAADAEPILDIRVSDGQIGRTAPPLFLHYDSRESGLDAPFGHIVENIAIRRTLLTRLADLPDVTIIAPGRVVGTAQRPAAIDVTLDDGRTVAASLLIAADGARSALRSAAGIGVAEFPYPQTGIVCHVAHH